MTHEQAELIRRALNSEYAAWAGPRRSAYAKNKEQMALIMRRRLHSRHFY